MSEKDLTETGQDLPGSDLGYSNRPLCREPWESYYILRRGILPCCYGNPIIGTMSDWKETWNSPQLQEIRSHLSRGELSPYCLESLGCPIVQRELAKKKEGGEEPSQRPEILRLVNRILFGLPAKVFRMFRR